MPALSIIIAAYNDWLALDECLRSLSQQVSAPSFEVLVIDDGSDDAAPEVIHQWIDHFPLVILRQPHAGISTARNRGIQNSSGEVLLFVDADCRLHGNCLHALNSTVVASPQHDCFQLRLKGSCSTLVGKTEELRLIAFQKHMLQPDGRIRYLNTAGFAIRHMRVNNETGVFDPAALRAEDTLLLANLLEHGELPLFIPDAVVEHVIPLSLMWCLLKDIRSVYLERRTYDIIASKGMKVRVTHRERLRLVYAMWEISGERSIGRSAWLVLVGRQAFQRAMSFGYRLLGTSRNT